MKLIKIRILVFLVVILAVLSIGLHVNNKKFSDKKYIFKSLFELPISTDTHDSFLSIYHSNFKYSKDYYLITNTSFTETSQIPGPRLLMIDADTNFYIDNAFENIKIFDKNGNFVHKFEYPVGFSSSDHSMDKNGNAFVFLTSLEQNEKKLVYRINLKNNIEILLSDAEVKQLQPDLSEPRNALEGLQKKKKEQGEGKYYFDELWGDGIKTIFTNENGRFISPTSLNIYKIDTSFNKTDVSYIRDDDLFDIIKISAYCNDKIVNVSSVKIDVKGNLFISGVKSNNVENTKVKYAGKDVESIKVYNLKFFLWEFVRKQ